MRRLNLDQLHALVEVVRLGSFSAAARGLNLSQPAVSLQIRELEQRLGLELVERLGKQAYATAAGAELIERAARIAREVDDAEDAMRRHRDGWLGRVRIGTGAAIVTYLLPPLLRTLRRAHPDIEIVINSGTTERIVERLARNEVDIGLVTLPVHDRTLVVQPLREDAMLAVLPPSERGAPATMDAAGLARYPVILDAVGAQMHALARDWFRDAGVDSLAIVNSYRIQDCGVLFAMSTDLHRMQAVFLEAVKAPTPSPSSMSSRYGTISDSSASGRRDRPPAPA